MTVTHGCFLSSSSSAEPNAKSISCCATAGICAFLLSGRVVVIYGIICSGCFLIPALSPEKMMLSADSLQQLLLQQQVWNLN